MPVRANVALTGLTCLALAACGPRVPMSTQTVVRGVPAGTCGAEGTAFFGQPLSAWPTLYHSTVGGVLAEAKQVSAAAEVTDCTNDDRAAGLPAGSALTSLARTLTPWQQEDVPIHQDDLTAVLLEFLRTYECSLRERESALPLVAQGVSSQASREQDTSSSVPLPDPSAGTTGAGRSLGQTTSDGRELLDRGTLITWQEQEQRLISEELAVARPALTRALTLVSATQLDPLRTELHCLLRTSVDLRNVLSLVAEGAACVGRLEDAWGIDRDPAPAA